MHQPPVPANAEALAVTRDVRPDGDAFGKAAEKGAKAVRNEQARARLIADAERTAESITDERLAATALAYIARALAATDPHRAERTAQSITDDYLKGRALATIAKALAATDPDRASRLITEAERTAQSITDEYLKSCALAYIAKTLAATDPDRASRLITDAERIAQSITHEYWRGSALAEIVEALPAGLRPSPASHVPGAEVG